MRLDRRVNLIAWRVIFHVWDVEEVEAMACREGLQLGAKWCWSKGMFGCRPRLGVPARQPISALGDENRTPGDYAWRRRCLGGSIQTGPKCILKLNCLRLARLLQQPFIQRSSLHPIREATEVRGVFQELIVKHTRREQNGVAHEHTQLAKRVVHVAV